MRRLLAAGVLCACGGRADAEDGGESSGTGSASMSASSATASDATTPGTSSTSMGPTSSTETTMEPPDTTGAESSSSTGGGPPGGRLIVDDDYPAWFRYEGGGSHFLCAAGDPEDFLYRGTENADGTRSGDQQDIIDKLGPTGANGIYFQAIRSHGGDGDASHNPFNDHGDPTSGLNEAILDQWETWLTDFDEAGVVSYFFIYDDSANPWGGGDSVGADEQAFLEAIVDRFEHHELLVWVVGEEYSEAISTPRAVEIAQIMSDADDYDHPLGNHQLTGLDFDFPTDPNIDQFTIQYNVGTAAELHDGMVTAFGDAGGAYNLNMSEAAMHGAGAVARTKNWATAMGGAYVMVIEWDVATTAETDLEQCGYLVRFFESTRFRETAPHDELARDDTTYVLAAPPDIYIAYGNNASTALGLADLAKGDYDLHWLDAVSGTTADETITAAAGDAAFPLPAGFGTEVAVYVEAQ